MDSFDNILPLIMLFLFWVFSKKGKETKKNKPPMPVRPPRKPTLEVGGDLLPDYEKLKLKIRTNTTQQSTTPPVQPIKENKVSREVSREESRNCEGLDNFNKLPGKRQLRRAIIWAEILGPPVSLR